MGRIRAALLVVLGVLLFGLTAGSAAAATAVIDARDDAPGPRWVPQNVTINTGDTVRWEFDSALNPHNLKATGGNWTSPDETNHAPNSAPIEQQFDAAGTYAFLCDLHTGMTGTVTVEAAPPAGELDTVLVFSKTGGFRHDSIPQGIAAIQALGTANGFTVTPTEDAAVFTDANLAQYDVVVFLSTTGEVLSDAQQGAFERYIQAGGGFAGIHAASDTEYSWPWYGELVGGYFRSHPPGTPTADVDIEDGDEPSTTGLPPSWTRTDEWYNFQHPTTPVVNGSGTVADFSPRARQVKVLATVDEATYDEQDGNTVNDDHPVAWCSDFDGGRSWYTAMGHTQASFADADFRQHLLGGLRTAAGAGDCGDRRDLPPTAADFEKITLNNDTNAPLELDIASDGRVFYIERDGRVQMWSPGTQATTTVGTIPVTLSYENGMLGIQLSPDFDTTGHIYLAYSSLPDSSGTNKLSRFTLTGTTLGSEQVIYTWQQQRDQCCHNGGSLDFGPDGSLYLSTGDNSNPFAHGFNPTDERPGRSAWDAQRTSANTNNPNGKVLRLTPLANPSGTPGIGSTYTIPAGNLFPVGTAQTLPEIYAMGFRNPFRIHVDQETGWVLLGDYGPDAGSADPNRGPQGSVEFNVVKEPGFYGWPYCVRENVPYNNITYTTDAGGGPNNGKYNCDAPVNDSPNNTGLTNLPPAIPATMWYAYSETDARFPDLGTGGAPTGGPRYYYDADSTSDTKFPSFYDGQWFMGEWNNDWVKTTTLNDQGLATGMACFAICSGYASPMDMEFGPDGSLYVIEWGQGFGSDNADSGVYRIDYVKGERQPIANAVADKDAVPVNATVAFSSAGSNDPDGTAITYLWNFGDGTPTSDAANPTHTYTTAGTYNATLTVTDESGATGVDTVRIIVGNERPVVTIDIPENGQVADFGDKVEYEVSVTDPDGGPGGGPLSTEAGTIDCSKVNIEVKLGHDTHAHTLSTETGCAGDFTVTGADGHGIDANVFTVLTASYTDAGNGPAVGVTGTAEAILQPKLKQAEYFSTTGRTADSRATSGDPGIVNEASTDVGAGQAAAFIEDGDWISFNPYNLEDLDKVTFRVASGGAGGIIELRFDSPTGPLAVASPNIAPTGGWQSWQDVVVDLPDTVPDGTHRLFVVFRHPTATGSLLNLNWFKFSGKGAAVTAPPEITATATPTSGEAPLDVAFDSTATDAENEALTYSWDFGVPGNGDSSTQADPVYTYAAPGNYTATLTVTDASGGKATTSVEVRVTRPLDECPTGPVRSDEFDGNALDTDRWTVLRPDAANPLSVSGGALTLPIANGSMYLGGTTAKNLVVQPMPDGTWSATAKITTTGLTENYHQAGLRLWSNDDNWASVHMIHAGGTRDMEFIYEANGQPRNEAADKVGGIPAEQPDLYYVRLKSDGTNLTAEYSWDGVDFEPVGRPAPLSTFTDPQIGPVALSDLAPSVPLARFDWIRFDPDGSTGGPGGEGIVDDFDGVSLGSDWQKIRGDQSAIVNGGTYQIPAQPGDIYGGRNDAKNLTVRDAPDGAWEATAKLNFEGLTQYQQAGIMVRGDDDNFIKFGRIAHSAAGDEKFEFIYENAGTPRNEAADSTANIPTDFPDDFWVRMTSDGTNVVGHYSTDGSAWTPVGRPAALPANAEIGLFAFSNDGVGNPIAAFDSFTLTGENVGGGGGGGPVGPSFDDQFDGSALDKTRWDAIVRDTPAEYTVGGGELTVTASLGDIYTGDTNPPPNNFILQDASHAGEDWTIETKISGATISNGYSQGGLVAYGDGDNYVKFDAVSDPPSTTGVTRLELRSEVAGAILNPQANVPLTPAQAAGDIWLRLIKEGNSYTGEYSLDGTTWTPFPDGAVTNAMVAPDFGLLTFSPQASSVGKTVTYDYFLLDGEDEGGECGCVAYGDDFDGAALDTTRFNAIATDDPSKYAVSGGALTVTTTAGEIYQGSTGGGPLLLQSADHAGDDYVLETKLTPSLDGGYSQGGIMVYGGVNDYVKINAISDDGQTRVNRLELRSEVGGTVSGTPTDPQIAVGTTDIWLRLTKAGNVYSGEYSTDGSTWTAFSGTVTNAMVAPDFGLYTQGVLQSGDTVKFDYFSIDGETGCEPGETNTAPAIGETTATPTIGTAPLAVQFATSATDAEDDDLNYSWDFGVAGTDADKSTSEDPTYTYAAAGTYTATLTVSDGDKQATKTVTVTVLGADDPEADFRVLVFSKTTGFRHSSIEKGIATIKAMGVENGFQVDATEDASVFRADVLSHYDTVVFLSTTGDPLNAAQQTAFENYVKAGGGYTGIHAAADTEYGWEWYGKLVGGYFKSHPAGTPTANVLVDDPDHQSTEGLPSPWTRVDEWYNYQSPISPSPGGGGTDYSPRTGGVHVLLTVDEASYDEGDDTAAADDHPISWCQRYDGGRSFYTGMGHTDGTFDEPLFRAHLLSGLEITAGVVDDADCGVEPGTGDDLEVTAYADPTSGAAPLAVNFTANVGLPNAGGLQYKWTFPGGGTAYGATVTTTFTTPGTKTVTLEVTDGDGNTGIDTVDVVVSATDNLPPVIVEAEADDDEGPAPHEVWFHAVANDPDGPESALRYRWDFGDGGQALGDEAEHTYLTAGTFTATLTVTDQAGKTVTKTFTITTTNPPGNVAPTVVAGAVPVAGDAPLQVLFTAQGTDPDGDVLTYAWTFGDGSSASGRRARHTYTTTGTYKAKVTVNDGAGHTASAEVTVVVGNPLGNQPPSVEVAADRSGGTAPVTVKFTAAGLDPEGDAMTYAWDFGDTGQAAGTSPTHTYTAAGTYTAKVTVTTADGQTGFKTVVITVAAPVAPVAPNGGAAPVAPPPAAAAPTLAMLQGAGLPVTVTCAGDGKAQIRLRLSRAAARKLGLERRFIARTVVSCTAGQEVTVKLKAGKTARRALKRKAPASLRLAVVVALGGVERSDQTLTLKR